MEQLIRSGRQDPSSGLDNKGYFGYFGELEDGPASESQSHHLSHKVIRS